LPDHIGVLECAVQLSLPVSQLKQLPSARDATLRRQSKKELAQ
jgi:hypothetical protein